MFKYYKFSCYILILFTFDMSLYFHCILYRNEKRITNYTLMTEMSAYVASRSSVPVL
jgi:hypothetical protein